MSATHTRAQRSKFRLPILLLAAALLLGMVGCSDKRSSEIDSELAAQPDPQVTNIGTALGIANPKPAHAQDELRFILNAGAPSYADAFVLVRLEGEAELVASAAITKSLWRQESGPEAVIITPNAMTSYVVLPAVESATQLRFSLAAADEEGYVAHVGTAITVLPVESPLALVPVAALQTEMRWAMLLREGMV